MQVKDFEDLYETEEKMWWFAGMREISAALLDELRPRNIENILDVGCGTGFNLQWLERYGAKKSVIGLEIETPALNFCRKRENKKLVQASATDLPFPENHFDLVTSFDVLVQIPGENSDEKAIAEMFRVLKPDGILFLRVAAYKWMFSGHDKSINTQRRYDLPEISHKLKNAGFTILRKTYANSLLFPAAFFRRIVLGKLGIAGDASDVKPLPASMDWLNRILTKTVAAEAKFLKKQNRRLPFGLSAICVARKD